MAVLFLLSVLCMTAAAAPPQAQGRYSQQSQLQLNSLDYYLDNPETASYFSQAQQKHAAANANERGGERSERLENLENPDSEVELVPGVAQPQQPTPQNPVSPNLPGYPGQRVYIVHMPIPGYRGGYQPVYVVAAAPNGANPNYVQGNPNYVQGGYQNAILLDPSGQGLISPFLGYQRPGFGQPGLQGVQGIQGVQGGQGVQGLQNPGLVLQQPLGLARSYDLIYQDPAAFGYQPVGVAPNAASGSVRLSQLVSLAQPEQSSTAQAASSEKAPQHTEQSRVGEGSESTETKLASAEPRRNARPTPPHALAQRNKKTGE